MIYRLISPTGEILAAQRTPFQVPPGYSMDDVPEGTDPDVLQDVPPAKAWDQLRREGYGTVADQLDLIYHQGLDAWAAHIAAVKAQFPKPVV